MGERRVPSAFAAFSRPGFTAFVSLRCSFRANRPNSGVDLTAANMLTNAHTHLELSGLAQLLPGSPVSMGSWLPRVGRAIDGLDHVSLVEATESGIAALRSAGIAQVCDITSTGASIEPLQRSGIRGVAFLEIRGSLRREAMGRLADAQARIDEAREAADGSMMRVGLALHSPYLCHPDMMKAAARWCRSESVPLAIHASESPGELQWITYARALAAVDRLPIPGWGSRQLARGLALGMREVGTVAYLDRLGVLDAQPLLAHCVHLSDDEIRRLAQTGCHVVHCPRSNHRLSCGRMPLERFLEAGVSVHLGTDSLASCPSLDIRDEVEFAVELHEGQVDAKTIELVAVAPL